LDNRTNYSWRDKANREYTPNYPFEIMTEKYKASPGLYGFDRFEMAAGHPLY
jgi:hypothetical protein